MLSLEEIKNEVDRLASIINVPLKLLPTYGYSDDFARPYIDVNSRGYHFIIVERGEELQHKITQELDVLLYWIFEGITFSMAANYEFNNRIENVDSRWTIFKKQEELLAALNKIWQQKQIEVHRRLLKGYS